MEEKNTNATKRRNPVTWVPSCLFCYGIAFCSAEHGYRTHV